MIPAFSFGLTVSVLSMWMIIYFFAKEDSTLDALVAFLQKGFRLTSQGSGCTFPCIGIKHNSDCHLILDQQCLIKKSIAACGL
jgi:hypothetical protein